MRTINWEGCEVILCRAQEVPENNCFISIGSEVGIPVSAVVERSRSAVANLGPLGGAYPLYLDGNTKYEFHNNVLTVKSGADEFKFRCL